MPLDQLHQISSAIGAGFYALFLAFCLTRRSSGGTGLAISLAALATLAFILTQWWYLASALARFFELAYLFTWTLFTSRILLLQQRDGSIAQPPIIATVVILSGVTLIVGAVALLFNLPNADWLLVSAYRAELPMVFSRTVYLATILQVVCGIVMLEQVMRNSQSLYQWRSRLIYISLAAIYGYTLFKAGLELLFQRPVAELDSVYALALSIAVPLLVVGSLRNRNNPLRINVSHAFVFQTGTLLGIGFFLVSLGLVGYYVRLLGSWALALFALAATGALTALAVLAGSTQIRRSLRVTLAKTFFEYRYDYRDRWLEVTRQLGSSSKDLTLGQVCVQILSDVVVSSGGAIFFRPTGGKEGPMARIAALESSWTSPLPPAMTELFDGFYRNYNWVIDLNHLPPEARAFSELRDNEGYQGVRIVIPLFAADRLVGVCLLAETPTRVRFHWEDYDLLKLIANQVAQTLYLFEADRSLRESRQFQAFNQVSAFVAHDIKTVTAQLKLLHRNAQVHRANPDFIDDMLETIENAASRMEKLQTQLQQERREDTQRTELESLINELRKTFSNHRPLPTFQSAAGELAFDTDAQRLGAALTHLINNAIDATAEPGTVRVTFDANPRWLTICIEDEGSGMSRRFIEEQLFQPFQSTKGLTGMGIGAYQAREYIRSLGGDLNVASTLGEGTCFTLRLPLGTTNE